MPLKLQKLSIVPVFRMSLSPWAVKEVPVLPNGQMQKPCVPDINAIDPTAAGDSFVAAFCVAVSAGLDQDDALTLATHTAALTVSALGAQPSLPYLSQVIHSLQKTDCYHQLAAEVGKKLGGTNYESP